MKVSLAAILSVGFLPTYFATSLTFSQESDGHDFSCTIDTDKPHTDCFKSATDICKIAYSDGNNGSKNCLSFINQFFDSFGPNGIPEFELIASNFDFPLSINPWREFGDSCVPERKSSSVAERDPLACAHSTDRLISSGSYINIRGVTVPVSKAMVDSLLSIFNIVLYEQESASI